MGEKEVLTKEGENEDCCVGEWEKETKGKDGYGEERPSGSFQDSNGTIVRFVLGDIYIYIYIFKRVQVLTFSSHTHECTFACVCALADAQTGTRFVFVVKLDKFSLSAAACVICVIILFTSHNEALQNHDPKG